MGPIDYSLGNVPNPQATFLQGIQQGTALNALQQQQAQQQAALAAQQRVQSVLSNPDATHADLMSIIGLMDPKMSAEVLKAREAASKEQAQAAIGHGMQVVAALRSPSPEVGVQMLEDRATALENSGKKQEAARFRQVAEQAKQNPAAASNLVGIGLAGLPGAKEAFDSLAKLGEDRRAEEQAPGALRKVNADAAKAEADAAEAAIKAKYGEQSVLLDLQKKGWDITHIQQDIAIRKEANRIAAMQAAASSAGNELKRQELGIQIKRAQTDLDQQVRTRAADVESARSSIDNMLNTADRILAVPDDTRRAALGGLDSRLPTLQSDVADFEALVENLGAQTFIAQIPAMKGTGSLSEREGDKLQASLQNLSLKQSPQQFETNIREVQRLMIKARKNLTTRYGLPETVPDTPAAAPGAAEIDALVKKYGGGR